MPVVVIKPTCNIEGIRQDAFAPLHPKAELPGLDLADLKPYPSNGTLNAKLL